MLQNSRLTLLTLPHYISFIKTLMCFWWLGAITFLCLSYIWYNIFIWFPTIMANAAVAGRAFLCCSISMDPYLAWTRHNLLQSKKLILTQKNILSQIWLATMKLKINPEFNHPWELVTKSIFQPKMQARSGGTPHHCQRLPGKRATHSACIQLCSSDALQMNTALANKTNHHLMPDGNISAVIGFLYYRSKWHAVIKKKFKTTEGYVLYANLLF